MTFFDKQHGEIELIQGDFLHPQFHDLICKEATVIFINNYAFEDDLTRRIVFELLQNCADGTRIVSAKPLSLPRSVASRRHAMSGEFSL